MSWIAAPEPACTGATGEAAVEVEIAGRARDIGGFSVARVLPAPARRSAGPFVFFDHMVATTLAHLVMIGGAPLDGPRYIWWNFVSSNKARIEQAASDWKAGHFPKVLGDELEFIPLTDTPRFARSE